MTIWEVVIAIIPFPIKRIISGGQTGVDRAALDYAIDHHIPHGGWCPRGRLAEDGRIPDRYVLEETPTEEYPERTEKNVLTADGTLILYRTRITGGTQLTQQLCVLNKKPCFVINLEDAPKLTRRAFQVWLVESKVHVLNVAGPRESLSPGIYVKAKAYLKALF